MFKKIVGIATGAVVLFTFWDKLKEILDLKSFGSNSEFKVSRYYNLSITGGINGTFSFLLDIDVINKTDNDVLLNSLLITAYNEEGEYIGQSVPMNGSVKIYAMANTTVTGIQVNTELNKMLFDYGAPYILELISGGGNVEKGALGKTIKLVINIEINGIETQKTIELSV